MRKRFQLRFARMGAWIVCAWLSAHGSSSVRAEVLYASTGTNVLKFSTTGQPIALAGTLESISAFNVDALEFDRHGNLYYGHYWNSIKKVSADGTVSTFANIGIPYGMAFDTNENLYVCHVGSGIWTNVNTVSRITPDGVISRFAGGFSGPTDLAFDSKGSLYVANNAGGTISKVTPSGTISTFATNLVSPLNLAIDSNDNLFVSDGYAVLRFTPDGTKSVFADFGTSYASGLAFDGEGNLFVVDYNGGRILKYTPSGVASVFATGVFCLRFLAVGNAIPQAVFKNQPMSQTAEAGSQVSLGITVENVSMPSYEWFFNSTNAIASGTNASLRLSDVQSSDAGVYTAVVTDPFQMATSAPASLSIIAPVPRRNVPGIYVGGQAGAAINIESRDSLGLGVPWMQVGTVSPNTNAAWYFDLSVGAERFYRACTTNGGGQAPLLALYSIPALTVSGNSGDKVRVDGINRFGPVDAWFTLGIVELTNATGLFFDLSAPYSPARVYRMVTVP